MIKGEVQKSVIKHQPFCLFVTENNSKLSDCNCGAVSLSEEKRAYKRGLQDAIAILDSHINKLSTEYPPQQ